MAGTPPTWQPPGPGYSGANPAGLPPTVLERIERQRARPGEWGSDLSVPELAAVHSVGFTPRGVVAGTCAHTVLYPNPGWTVYGYDWADCPDMSRAMYTGRRHAFDRLAAEVTALGAHGAIGVRMIHRVLDHTQGLSEYTAIGTAVSHPGSPPLARPFISHLSGQEFAKLIQMGAVPCGVALGCAAVMIGPGYSASTWSGAGAWSYGAVQYTNWEIGNWTSAVQRARDWSVAQMQQEVRACGGDGVVGVEVRRGGFAATWRGSAGGEGEAHVVEMTALGTVVARFRRDADTLHPRPVLRLRRAGE